MVKKTNTIYAELISLVKKYFGAHTLHNDMVQIFNNLETVKYLESLDIEKIQFSEALIKRQKLNEEEIQELRILNILKMLVFKKTNTLNKDNLHELYQMQIIGKIVFEMELVAQELWKFGADVTKHTWWYQLPHCLCAVLDNHDYFGVNYKSITKSCPIHGIGLVDTKKTPVYKGTIKYIAGEIVGPETEAIGYLVLGRFIIPEEIENFESQEPMKYYEVIPKSLKVNIHDAKDADGERIFFDINLLTRGEA